MSTTGVVITISLIAVVLVGAAVVMRWSSRRRRRGFADLHSPRNRRAMKAERRRKQWAAGTAGAVGVGYTDSSGCSAGAGAGGDGCGGGGGGGCGGGCGGG